MEYKYTTELSRSGTIINIHQFNKCSIINGPSTGNTFHYGTNPRNLPGNIAGNLPTSLLSNITSNASGNMAGNLNMNISGGMAMGAQSPQQARAGAQPTAAVGTQTSPGDLGKRKLIQEHLLLHAYKCQQRENQANGENKQCFLPHCRMMKNVLNHLTNCQKGQSCQETSGNVPGTFTGPLNTSSAQQTDAMAQALANTNFTPGVNASGNSSHNIGIPKLITGNTPPWQQFVTQDLRNYLVFKIVQAIIPSPDPQAMKDKRMGNVVAYARKVEKDMYEQASSREEYYYLIAEKIYKIRKELEEKMQKRIQETGGSATAGGVPTTAVGTLAQTLKELEEYRISTQEEYCNFMAKKIDKIKKELKKEKWQKRMRETGGSATAGGVPTTALGTLAQTPKELVEKRLKRKLDTGGSATAGGVPTTALGALAQTPKELVEKRGRRGCRRR